MDGNYNIILTIGLEHGHLTTTIMGIANLD